MASYQQGVPIEITDTFYLNGVATNPTLVVYSILGPDGTVTTYQFPGAPEINNPSPGRYVLSLSPPALPGLYQYDVNATGTVVASRAGSFFIIADASSPTDISWAVGGPCAPWTSSGAVWNCCGQPTTTIDGVVCAVDFTSEALAASEVLFELSGRQFSGACEKTVRPCWTGCTCGWQVLSRGHVIGPWDWSNGWSWGGWSWMCDEQPCGCQPLSRVLLSGYPVREIVQVKIDGAIVNPNTYRLDGWRWLTRVRDPADPDTVLLWPSCQALDLPDTAAGTFSITYRYGMDPPLIAQRAAAELACNFYQVCSAGAGECVLPPQTTRVTRQGVTIDKGATISWFYGNNSEGKGWQTGMALVDTFLNSLNPTGMQQRPRTWSPDGHRYAPKLGV